MHSNTRAEKKTNTETTAHDPKKQSLPRITLPESQPFQGSPQKAQARRPKNASPTSATANLLGPPYLFAPPKALMPNLHPPQGHATAPHILIRIYISRAGFEPLAATPEITALRGPGPDSVAPEFVAGQRRRPPKSPAGRLKKHRARCA